MSYARGETQTMLADMLRRLLEAENGFEDRHRRLSGDAPNRLALWPSLAEQGVLGAAFSEDAGGFGGSARDLAVVMSEIGRSLVVEPVLSTAVAGQILAGSLQTASNIEALISGDRITIFAHGEGQDAFAPRATLATLAPDGSANVISGEKTVVRHGDLATDLVVTASIDGATGAFLVEATAEGVTLEPFRLIDGSSGARITFQNTPARPIGAEDTVMAALDRALVALAAETVGILDALNAATFAYLRTRQQFGLPLASFQALQHRAADMHSAAEEARVLTERAIEAIDTGDADASALASAAKALSDMAGLKIGHEAVQMHGGMGVSDELDVSHYLRRLVAIRAELGSADTHRRRFAALGASAAAPSAFRDEVRGFVQAHLPQDLAAKGRAGLKIDKADYVRWEKILREKGWFAGAWPEAHGGPGWDLERQLIFVQEAALNDAPMIMPYGVNMVGPVLQAFGTPQQQATHLPDILSSTVWWCQGYSEPNAGSDLASLKTTATRDGDHYVVNGSKMWTTEAHWADMMHCLVRTDREVKAQRGISFLLIDMKTPGITVRPIVTIDGQHHTNQVFLDNVRVPVGNLVGGEGQGWSIAKFLLANERVAIADTGPKLRLLSKVRYMLEQQPEGSGRTRLEDALAETEIQLLALCALEETYVRAWSEGGNRDGPEASVLKIRGTEILQRLTEIALEIEGPLAAVHDPEDLHLGENGPFSAAQQASFMAHQYLYGRCWSIFGGANEIQRNIIARSLVGG